MTTGSESPVPAPPPRPILPPGHPPFGSAGPQAGAADPVSGTLHWSVIVKPLVEAAQIAVGLLPLFVLGVGVDHPVILAIYGTSVAIRIVTGIIRYTTFSYAVSGSDLVLTWGLVGRYRRVIPTTRIVNISTRRALWHRIFGAEELRLETAGGAGEDAVIEALRNPAARTLRRAVERARGHPESAVEDTVLRRLTVPELLLHGLTSSQLAAVGAVAGFIYENLSFFESDADRFFESAPTRTVLLVVAAIALVTWLGSVALSAIRFGGFTLRRTPEGYLATRFGLINIHEGRLVAEKVQSLAIHESLLRRPLRLATVKVLTAGGTAVEEPRAGTEYLLPLAHRAEIPGVIREVFGDFAEIPELERVHRKAIRRNFIRVSIVPIAALLLAARWWPPALWLTVAWLPLGWIIALRRYHHTGYRTLDRYVVVREGFFDRVTHIVPKAKLQALSVRRNPIDLRLGLCALSLDTAARSALRAPRVRDIEPAVATSLRREALDRETHPSALSGAGAGSR
jgi:putative membrane protein